MFSVTITVPESLNNHHKLPSHLETK